MKRHVAKMANTDQRLVVVFMQIPGREDHALVIPTDTLPARYEQAVMEILESPEGQNEETFAHVLSRRLMPDSGKPVLQALHEGRMLMPVPVANVMMMPMPNMPFPLSSILDSLGRKLPPPVDAPPDLAVEKWNQIQVNQKIEGVENRRAIAQNLLIEADMLEAESRKKRAYAYTVAPEIAPKPAAVALNEVPASPKAKTAKAIKPGKPMAATARTPSEALHGVAAGYLAEAAKKRRPASKKTA